MGDSVLLPQIRNLKNVSDLRRKQRQQRQALQTGIRVDRDAEDSFKLAAQQIKLNMLPLMPNELMLQNAAEDKVAQYNTALEHLKSIMPAVYASQVMQQGILGDHIGISEFNRHWPGFQKFAANVTNLTPSYFMTYWQKYRKQLEATNTTGVEQEKKNLNPIEEDQTGTIVDEPYSLRGKMTGQYQKYRTKQDTLAEAMPSNATELPRPPEINDEPPDEPVSLLSSVGKAFLKKLQKQLNTTSDWRRPIDITTSRNDTFNTTSSGGDDPPPPDEPGAGRAAVPSGNPETQPSERPWYDPFGGRRPNYPPPPPDYTPSQTRILPQRPKISIVPPSPQPLLTGGPELPSRVRNPKINILPEVEYIPNQSSTSLMLGDSTIKDFENNVEEVKKLPRDDQLQIGKASSGIMGYLKQQMPSMSDIVAAGIGLGFAVLQFKRGMYNWEQIVDAYMSQTSDSSSFTLSGGGACRRKGNAKVIGYGIAADVETRYKQFGCYLIHIPSLNNNRINIKFPSFASHPKIPPRIASDALVALLKNLLEEGSMKAPFYAALSDAEKEYFDDLAHKCKIGGKLGIAKKEDNADMRRFQIVRGEILSGNDAPQLIKELKLLTLKLVTEGKIPKRSAHDLLFEIAIL